MSKIGEVLSSLEGNQQQLEKFETLVHQDKQHFIKLCIKFILYVMNNVPAKYERKIFSFFYEGVYVQDEKGYNYCTSIPNKKELDDLKVYLSGYGGIYSHDIVIDRYFLLKQNNINYICVDLRYTEYDPYDEDFDINLGRYILPIEQIDWVYNFNTYEDKNVQMMNKQNLDKWLSKTIEFMEKFIAEEKQKEEESAKKRKEEQLKEEREKEYQQYLELKKKFEHKQ